MSENAYEKLGNTPLGRVERVTLLDTASYHVERAYGFADNALRDLSEYDAGQGELKQVLRDLRNVKTLLESVMKKLEP